MPKKIQVNIPTPCTEDWDTMTPANRGRHCASCNKTVIDFSLMTDSQLAAFLKRERGSALCGRFYSDQLNRAVEVPRRRIPWLKYFLHVTIPAFLLSCKSSVMGAPLIGEYDITVHSMNKGDYSDANNHFVFAGRVLDTRGEPVPFANIQILNSDGRTTTDSLGNFEISGKKKKLSITVTHASYQSAEVDLVDGGGTTVITLNDVQDMSEVVVMASTRVMGMLVTSRQVSMVAGGIQVMDVIEEKQEIKSEGNSTNPMIKVYPNPVQSGTSINIACENLPDDNYSIQLFNMAGQRVYFTQSWIDDESQVLNFSIPILPSGTYIVNVIGKETRKKLSDRIVVVKG